MVLLVIIYYLLAKDYISNLSIIFILDLYHLYLKTKYFIKMINNFKKLN